MALVRHESTDEGTFGVLAFGASTCGSLELPWRDNRRRVSCIPAGRYRCMPTTHRRLGRVVALLEVPGRAGILIHSANFAGDEALGWQAQLEGCIAPFERHGRMRNRAGEMQRAGLVSRSALGRVLDWADDRPFDLLIKDA